MLVVPVITDETYPFLAFSDLTCHVEDTGIGVLSKSWKPDNFELHNFLKLSFKNIRDLHSNFVDCEFFIESNSKILTFLLCVIQTWMTQLILAISL